MTGFTATWLVVTGARFMRLLDKGLRGCLYLYRFCTWAFCAVRLRLTQCITPITRAKTTMRGVCVQHPIFQFWWKFAIWWESYSHFNSIVGWYLAIVNTPTCWALLQSGTWGYKKMTINEQAHLIGINKCCDAQYSTLF